MCSSTSSYSNMWPTRTTLGKYWNGLGILWCVRHLSRVCFGFQLSIFWWLLLFLAINGISRILRGILQQEKLVFPLLYDHLSIMLFKYLNIDTISLFVLIIIESF